MTDISGHTEVKMGSNRSFGLVFAAVFLIIALWPALGGDPVRLWSLGIALVFAGLAFAAPQLMRPLNRLWFLFGMLLSKIVSPIVMGVIFFVAVTPIGLIRRLGNPDPINQAFDATAETYWIDRRGEAPSSMRKQF